jgi:hypothetical protein
VAPRRQSGGRASICRAAATTTCARGRPHACTHVAHAHAHAHGARTRVVGRAAPPRQRRARSPLTPLGSARVDGGWMMLASLCRALLEAVFVADKHGEMTCE